MGQSQQPSTISTQRSLSTEIPDIATILQEWFDLSARPLPWRKDSTSPWGVLVSEVMSQQTQMSRVVPYWESWMSIWPNPSDVAVASSAEVLMAWGRLGYPRRALRLQECAQVVATQYDNCVPNDYDTLLSLPGIGDYTASAVCVFAFHQRRVVLDTNIRRVLSRLLQGEENYGGAATVAERELACKALPADVSLSIAWNKATMELGATICTAKNPQCDECPVVSYCAWMNRGRPGMNERRTRPRQRFQGTNRQLRGMILQMLRESATITIEDVQKCWHNDTQVGECISSLESDKLIVVEGYYLQLPK